MTVTMDSPKLRKLTRAQLRSLAKREVVRAVGKTEVIIRRLIRKHPKGVPVLDNGDNPSASSAPPLYSPILPAARDCSERIDKGKQVAETASPSPSSSSEALELLYPEDEPVAGSSNLLHESIFTSHPQVPQSGALLYHPQMGPIAFSGEVSSALVWQNSSHGGFRDDKGTRSAPPPPEDEDAESDSVYDYHKGAPTHYMVVDALRQFTTLVNTIPTMETRITESRVLLQRTGVLVEKATPEVRELTVTREYLEKFLLAKMKQKRELWDGTGMMAKRDRKLRVEWLRAGRRAENEKRWKEANELNKECGLEPEPFSAFASESEEEVIESLQTTPENSECGSPKRRREESVDEESDADSSVGATRKKRSRS